jgi:hypothetical protein
MGIKVLDTVVMKDDLPQHGLMRGDVGAVVEVYGPDSIEVEFVKASGQTQALVTLKMSQVRAIGPRDLLSVRQIDAA